MTGRVTERVTGWTSTDVATTLRRGILALAAIGIAGTTVELVFLRHWSGATQLVVWPAMLLLVVGLWVVVRRPSVSGIRWARILSATVLVFAAVGIALHVRGNLEAGPLDRVYATTWDGLSSLEQWWLAITGGVGPAPVLAPGALSEIALMILLATVAHPALRPAD